MKAPRGTKRAADSEPSSENIKSRKIKTLKEQVAALELYQSRLKYAVLFPSSFIPGNIADKFSELSFGEYKAQIDWVPYSPGWKATTASVGEVAAQLSNLLIHSFVVNQHNFWMLITQMEVYYKDKAIDDIAFVTKNDIYTDELEIKMAQQTNERGGSWYELRITYGKFEAIITGGLAGDGISDSGEITPFLGVGAPSFMASDDQIILFSPVTSAASVPCERMPRNYSRKQSLQKWCYKSVLFENKGFHTPSPLGMHLDNDGFVFVASKLIRLTATKNLKNEDLNSLLTYLNGLDYWKYLGFEEKPIDEQILTRITTMRAKKERSKLSQSKSALVELLLSYGEDRPLSNQKLTLVFNGLLYPQIKKINKNRVKKRANILQNRLFADSHAFYLKLLASTVISALRYTQR